MTHKYIAVIRATEYGSHRVIVAYTLDTDDDGKPVVYQSRAAARRAASRELASGNYRLPQGCYDLRLGSITS